jgi:hypothetical protein
MKLTYTLITCLILTLLAGCNGKTSALLESTSANGKAKLTVTGTRTTTVESWKVVMKVKAYNFKEGELKFEIYASDLNNETVLFNWTDENNCDITFKQKDNTERKFHLIASPNQLQMAEV